MTKTQNLFEIIVKNNVSDEMKNKQAEKKTSKETDFETAISQTGYGKFNYILLFLVAMTGLSIQCETSVMAYVFPVAQCDLNLTLGNKGMLNAITYIGMLTGALIWGFLSDTIGRKKVMVTCFMTDAFFVAISGFSQSFELLLVTKFLGGFMITGSYVTLISHLCEFQTSQYRSRTQIFMGVVYGMGNVVLPLTAWGILFMPIHFVLHENIVLHAWNIYILLSAVPSAIAGLGYILIPESPKFLMAIGKTDEALKILRKVYSLNTGKPKDSYPVKSLVDETAQNSNITKNRSNVQAIKEGFKQLTPLYLPPLLLQLLLICFLQAIFGMSVNTIRLWMPQIFQSINDYKVANNGSTASMCTMLTYLQPSEDETQKCIVIIDSSVYINSTILGTVQFVGYLGAILIINLVQKRLLLRAVSAISGICIASLFFARDVQTVLSLTSIALLFANVCNDIMLTIVVDIFPTSLRTMALTHVSMSSRLSSMIGNIIFPLLISIGCAPPFFLIGALLIGCTVLSIFLPKTDLVALK